MFYLVEVSTGDTKITAKAIYTFATETEAIANFHSKLGAAMKSDLFDTELCIVIDENGTVIKREKYIK